MLIQLIFTKRKVCWERAHACKYIYKCEYTWFAHRAKFYGRIYKYRCEYSWFAQRKVGARARMRLTSTCRRLSLLPAAS